MNSFRFLVHNAAEISETAAVQRDHQNPRDRDGEGGLAIVASVVPVYARIQSAADRAHRV